MMATRSKGGRHLSFRGNRHVVGIASRARLPQAACAACLASHAHGTSLQVTLTVLGEVERVTFENEESGFRVIRLGQVTGLTPAQRRLTAVGVMQAVGPGTRVRVSGRLETDPKHGERLRVESLVVVAPDTMERIEKYLGSGVVAGIGPGFAKRIVNYFKMETLHILDNESHRLAEVPGLGKARVDEVRQGWAQHRTRSNVLLALQSHGASPGLASKILERFGDHAAEVVEKNPYRLSIEIAGVGFKTADRIARAAGLPKDHPERAQAGVLHDLRTLADAGHCYCTRPQLCERTAEMLQINDAHIDAAIDALWAKERVVVEDERVYLKTLFEAEQRIAKRVCELLAAPAEPLSTWSQKLEAFERGSGVELAPGQRNAVRAAAERKVLVVTGGPGVGKTTLVRAIVGVLNDGRRRIRLAAPTGRAAKRLTESTAQRAVTLHRLLEVEGRGNRFARNAQNPLEVDLLIIDEASMIDVTLAASLLDAVPNAARLVIVGDADQLPSVGPGAFLCDLISSGKVPVARLDVIFRQSGQSGIVQNSHAILRGELPEGDASAEGDFFVIHSRAPERAADLVRQVVTERIPARFGLDPLRDVQVLCPMHRGTAGTVALNEMLQDRLNPHGEVLNIGSTEFRVGDKVLQTRNDYSKEVFNGDLGEIISVQPDGPLMVVQFDTEDGERQVTYEKAELSQLTLAYATSIHKSQGSEYPAVVIVFLTSHFVMLSRNLLYTAVTRAKKLCVLIADPRALSIALGETRKESRATGLAARLLVAAHQAALSSTSET